MRCLLLAGSVNRKVPYFSTANGDGISVLMLDTDTGRLERISAQGGIDNPTYLAFDQATSTVFAVSEVFGWNEGTVSAYRLDHDTGSLSYLNKQPTLGSLPAHVWFDDALRLLLVANYSHETADESPGRAFGVYRVSEDGHLASPEPGPRHRGRSIHPVRQRVPHPHGAWIGSGRPEIAVTDLGLDRVFFYPVNSSGHVCAEPTAECRLAAGDGPRHLAFSHQGRTLQVVAELSSTMVTFERSPEASSWIQCHRTSTLPEEADGQNLCADLQMSWDGRFAYVTNRGHDSIVTIELGGPSRVPRAIGWMPSGGTTPRSMTISPDGTAVVVANQDSEALVVLRRDSATGHLGNILSFLPLGSPTFIRFVKCA